MVWEWYTWVAQASLSHMLHGSELSGAVGVLCHRTPYTIGPGYGLRPYPRRYVDGGCQLLYLEQLPAAPRRAGPTRHLVEDQSTKVRHSVNILTTATTQQQRQQPTTTTFHSNNNNSNDSNNNNNHSNNDSHDDNIPHYSYFQPSPTLITKNNNSFRVSLRHSQ